MNRILVPITMPVGLTEELDELIKAGKYTSRSEALRYAARLLLMLERSTNQKAEHYAYHEIVEGFRRGVTYVPRHRRAVGTAERERLA